MDISLINSQSLLHLLSLTEKKEELLQILEQIDAEIHRTVQGRVSVEVITSQPAIARQAPAALKPAAKPAKKVKAGRSGGLKDRILDLLDAAGSAGLRVKDIAAKLGAKPANISVWFSTTGKGLTTRLSPGHFAKKGVSKPAAALADKPVKAAKKAKKDKPAKKSKMSPEGRAKIAAMMKARWAARRAAKPTAKPTAKPAAKPAKAKKKSGLTPEGRAKLAANMKARWAARKAAAPEKTFAVAKKTKTSK